MNIIENILLACIVLGDLFVTVVIQMKQRILERVHDLFEKISLCETFFLSESIMNTLHVRLSA